MREGVTPALKATRTAFNFPWVKRGASATSTCCRFSVAVERVFTSGGRTSNRWRKVCKSVSTPRGILPRRFISSSVAVCRNSNSPSLKCLIALGRSFGKICRCGAVSIVAPAAGNFVGVAGEPPFTAPVESRSGVVRSAGSPSDASNHAPNNVGWQSALNGKSRALLLLFFRKIGNSPAGGNCGVYDSGCFLA